MIPRWPAQAVAVMSALAVVPLPYGYYQILRLAACAAAVYYLYTANKKHIQLPQQWALVVIALLFNPIFPVYLTRSIWFFFDLAAAVYFYTLAVSLKRNTQI